MHAHHQVPSPSVEHADSIGCATQQVIGHRCAHRRPARRTFVTALSLALFAAMAAIGPVVAQETAVARPFDIPSQDLSSALNQLAMSSQYKLLYRTELVAGRRSPQLKGDYTPVEALQHLLHGTGLTFRMTGGNTILVERPGEGGVNEGHDRPRGDTRGMPAMEGSEATEMPTVLVTGTNIRAGDAVASPFYAFGRDDFAAMGASSAQQVLRTLPQNFTGGSSETATAVTSTRNGADFNLGFGAGVNLRGLGTESTLVLLNGRRMAPGGFGNMTDVSTIPLSAIERIEVVPDGSSAVYGSDAVGGVVNFVLREDFQGAETNLRYGAVTQGGLRQTSISQVFGTAWATGSVLLNADYSRNQPLLASDRPFATGLQNGENRLSPDDKRKALLINGRQALGTAVTLSAVAYGIERDAATRNFDFTQDRQSTFAGTTTQSGGTVALDWRIHQNWSATLAHTRSRSKNARQNFLGATSALPELLTFVTATHDAAVTELEMEGALFALPGGEARLAFGAEHRTEDLVVDRSSGYDHSSFDRQVSAGYAELYLPLIGEKNAKAFARRLSFTLAGRYEDYDDVGAADTYKIGALWSPAQHLNLRATYGTSFRAPYLFQYDPSLSGGLVLDMPNPAAPAGFTRTLLILQMADANLGPENATIWSAGLDVAPELLGIRLSATYFDIAYKDRISAGRFHFGAFTDPTLAALISTPPDPRLMALLDEVVQFFNLTPGGLDTVEATFDGRTRNQASTRMTGMDLLVGRDFATAFGHLDVGLNLTKLLSHEITQAAGAPAVDILDTVFNPVDFRARASLGWRAGGWSASAFLNYTGAYKDNQQPGVSAGVAPWTTVDLGMAYEFGEQRRGGLKGLTLRFNAFNVFDRDPPRIFDYGASYGSPGYDTENASPIGRLVAVEVSKRW